MRLLRWAGLTIFIIFMMLASVLFFASGGVQNAACIPTTQAIAEGSVTVGSGPASDDYFAHFGDALVVEKKTNAALIIQVARKEDLTEYSTAIAIATALQESGLRNLSYGDGDSRGLFQQRPSVKSWGTAAEIMDPTHATKAFIDAMKQSVPERDSMLMIEVAIAVQNPSIAAYHSSWVWDDIALELVKDASLQSCAAPEAHLPLDAGYGVSSMWGYSDPAYPAYLKPHKGIDLSNYADGRTFGKPVYAVLSGVVVASGKGNGCQSTNTVTILHDGGVMTGYLHMNGRDITVGVGDTVVAGQQIGSIASCGLSTGPHLHFEVTSDIGKDAWIENVSSVTKYGRQWLDPEQFMAHYGIDLTP